MKDEQINQLTDDISSTVGGHVSCTKAALERLNELGCLHSPGTPIEVSDIRKGDVIRVSSVDQTVLHEVTYTAVRDGHSYSGTRWDECRLLSRPKPELPTEPGVRFKAKSAAGPVEWHFITTANGLVLCVDSRDWNGDTWQRDEFDQKFIVTEVLT